MKTTDLEKKLESYQLIINRAITQGKYPIATAGVQLALQINPVCDITRTLHSIIHHRQGRYDISALYLINIISNIDDNTLEKIKTILNNYDIPSDLVYFESLNEIYSKIKFKKTLNIIILLFTVLSVLLYYFKVWG